MKIAFQQFLNRFTGVTTPFIGLTWNPPAMEVDVATGLIRFLEDRRVLYNPYEAELVSGCIESINQIRRRITEDMARLKPDSELAGILSLMRAACRRFQDHVETGGLKHQDFYQQLGMAGQMVLGSALGEIRAAFGYHIAYIALRYQIDVEEQLVSIFPASLTDKD